MSTITKEFTKEQLIEQAKKNIEVLRGAAERIPGASDAAVIHLKLAEITLASLEAEAVYQVLTGDSWVDLSKGAMDSQKRVGAIVRTVYTAPPAPVSVPDDVMAAMQKVARIRLDLNDFDGDKRGILDCLSEAEEALIEVVNRRAAMLQGADGNSPVIPDGWKLVPAEPTSEMQSAAAGAIRFDTTPLNKLWTGNAVYRAMLAAAPQPEVK